MSMRVVMVKLSASLADEIHQTRGKLLTDLLDRKATRSDFDPGRDMWSEVDHRDLQALLEPDEPFWELFAGDALVQGYEWTYGPPAYFTPAATRQLVERIREGGDVYPLSDMVDFIDRTTGEGKGLVVGVA